MTIFNQLPASLSGDKKTWGELQAAGRALAVAESAINYAGLTLLITETAREAAAQSRALTFFTQGETLPIFTFPDW